MIYAFDNVTLDEQRWEIHRAGRLIPTQVKVFGVLLHLVQNRNRVVTREELFETFWPGIYVCDGTLSRCISRIRQTIDQPRWASTPICTLHGKGYRFAAAVTVHAAEAASATADLSISVAGGSNGSADSNHSLNAFPDHGRPPSIRQAEEQPQTSGRAVPLYRRSYQNMFGQRYPDPASNADEQLALPFRGAAASG